jgi:hypothetical protein
MGASVAAPRARRRLTAFERARIAPTQLAALSDQQRAALRIPESITWAPKRGVAGIVARTCSQYWADLVRAGVIRALPPPAVHTPMVECGSGDRQCGGKFYPFYYGTGCWCQDCINNELLRQEREWEREQRRRPDGTLEGEEPTLAEERPAELHEHAQILAEMKAQNFEGLDGALPSDDVEDLVQEIAFCQQTGKILQIHDDWTREVPSDPPPPAL